jgi:hypothetical protein
MVQVIGAGTPRGPTFGQKLAGGINKGLDIGQQLYQQHQQREAMKQLGLPENVSPEIAKQLISERSKQNLTPLQQSQKSLADEKLKALQGQQQLFQELSGGKRQSNGAEGEGESVGLQGAGDEILNQVAAFAGQPGQQGIVGNMAKAEIERREKEKKQSFEREKFEYKKSSEKEKTVRGEAEAITKPLLLELQNARKNIPLQEQAIEDIQNAIPEVGGLDYIADVTGFEPLRSASGAKLKTALKDFFLSDLTRAGSRPNQWIEQQLADALPKIGRSQEANLVVAAGMKFKVDLAKKRIDLIDELAQQDQEKHGYVKPDIDSRASKLLKPFVEQRKKDLVDNITEIKKKHKNLGKEIKAGKYIKMMSPQGEVYEILPSDMKEAEEHGFIRQ